MAKKQFQVNLDNWQANEAKPKKADQQPTLFGDTAMDDNKAPSKGFTAQLDAFLAETFEAFDREFQEEADKPRPRGLDLLLQPTLSSKEALGHVHKASDTRRITLSFSKAQLNKLKSMAESEGIPLKDLISKLIDRYLEQAVS